MRRRQLSTVQRAAVMEAPPVMVPVTPPGPLRRKVRTPLALEEVVVVDTVAKAERVVEGLLEMPKETIHAVDTEVADIDLKSQGPVGHGFVTCFTVYSGPDAVYDDDTPGKTLWVETMDDDIFDVFRSWFEDHEVRKVWHNYGFDRHVLENRGLKNVDGFYGDTMHMARLYDAARLKTKGGDGYSLEALSADYLGARKVPMHEVFGLKTASKLKIRDLQGLTDDPLHLEDDDLSTRGKFICYAAYDAKATWQVREYLARELENQQWEPIIASHSAKPNFDNMLDFYLEYMVPFGELLTDMEKVGIFVDKTNHLATVEEIAKQDKEKLRAVFRDWTISLLGDDGKYFNPSSTMQIQTLLFGGAKNQKSNEFLPHKREFDIDPSLIDDVTPFQTTDPFVYVDREEFAEKARLDELKAELRALDEKSLSGSKAVLQQRFLEATSRPRPRIPETTTMRPPQTEATKTTTGGALSSSSSPLSKGAIMAMKVADLKEHLTERNVSEKDLKGLKKKDLQQRLLEVTDVVADSKEDFWEAKSMKDLTEWAKLLQVPFRQQKKKDLVAALTTQALYNHNVVQAIDSSFNNVAKLQEAAGNSVVDELEAMDKNQLKEKLKERDYEDTFKYVKTEADLRRWILRIDALKWEAERHAEQAPVEEVPVAPAVVEEAVAQEAAAAHLQEEPPSPPLVVPTEAAAPPLQEESSPPLVVPTEAAAPPLQEEPPSPPLVVPTEAAAPPLQEESSPPPLVIPARLAEVSTHALRGMCLGRCIRPPEDADRDELLRLVTTDDAYAAGLQREQQDEHGPEEWATTWDDDDDDDGSKTKTKLYKLKKTTTKVKPVLVVEAQTISLQPKKYTAKGWPAVSVDVLRDLAGKDPGEGAYGGAYDAFGAGETGRRACIALDALCQMGSIETMLGTFIEPLQELADDKSRVHSSLNFNTETGRLSSRRPNLQNQPALEKDKYHIRKAFQAEEGNMLVVADYGQLELRLLAAITGCQSMLQAFRDGGCFHSRTAVGMFDYVKAAVDSGEVLLEKGLAGADDTRPLVKEKFAAERRKQC